MREAKYSNFAAVAAASTLVATTLFAFPLDAGATRGAEHAGEDSASDMSDMLDQSTATADASVYDSRNGDGDPSSMHGSDGIDDGLAMLQERGWRLCESVADVDEFFKDARDHGLPALLLFRASSCFLSFQLEGHLVSASSRDLSGYEQMIVDVGTPEGRSIAERFGVRALPSLLVIDGDEVEMARLYGSSRLSGLGAFLRGQSTGEGTTAAMEERSLSNPFDIRLAYDLGRLHALRGDAIQAKRHFARLFVLRRMLDQASRSMVRGAADVGRLGQASDFGPVRSLVETDVAGVYEEIDTLIASSYFLLAEHVYAKHHEDPAQTIRILEELRRRFPDSPEARQAGLPIAVAHATLDSGRRARTELGRHLALHSSDAQAIAQALLESVELAELLPFAREQLDAHLEPHAGHHTMWYAAARIYEATGDVEAAAASLERAIELENEFPWYKRELVRLTAESGNNTPPEVDEDPVSEAAGTDEAEGSRESSNSS